LIPGVAYLLWKPRHVFRIGPEIHKTRGRLILAPIFTAIIYYTYVKAFTLGELIVTATIGQTSIIFTTILGAILLNEREHLFRRGVSSLFCVVGVILISY
jgi:uncharacterized membrane protein